VCKDVAHERHPAGRRGGHRGIDQPLAAPAADPLDLEVCHARDLLARGMPRRIHLPSHVDDGKGRDRGDEQGQQQERPPGGMTVPGTLVHQRAPKMP
jgi:hypothetical protein